MFWDSSSFLDLFVRLKRICSRKSYVIALSKVSSETHLNKLSACVEF